MYDIEEVSLGICIECLQIVCLRSMGLDVDAVGEIGGEVTEALHLAQKQIQVHLTTGEECPLGRQGGEDTGLRAIQAIAPRVTEATVGGLNPLATSRGDLTLVHPVPMVHLGVRM